MCVSADSTGLVSITSSSDTPLLLPPNRVDRHYLSVLHMAYHELCSDPHEDHPEEKPEAPASPAAENH